MSSFVVYGRIPIPELRKGAKNSIVGIGEWFKKHPKKKVCHASLWYGITQDIKRENVKEQVMTVVEAAITRSKSMTSKFERDLGRKKR